MFALIISIIAIALVVALAGATLYYGGDAFSKGSARSTAAALVNQGQQIAGAWTLYKADHGGTAPTVTDAASLQTALASATNNYLAAIPTSPISGLTEADGTTPKTSLWAVDAAGSAASVDASKEVCAEVAKLPGNGGVFSCDTDNTFNYSLK
jgi:hypothetical protein